MPALDSGRRRLRFGIVRQRQAKDLRDRRHQPMRLDKRFGLLVCEPLGASGRKIEEIVKKEELVTA